MIWRVRKNEIECVIDQGGHRIACALRRRLRTKACCGLIALLTTAGCADPVGTTQTVRAVVKTEPTTPRSSPPVQPPTEPPMPEQPPDMPPATVPTPDVSTLYAAIYCDDVPLEDSSLTKYADRVIASDGDGPSIIGGYRICGNIPVAVRVRGFKATVQVYETEIRLTFIGYRGGHVAGGRALTWAEPDTYTETIEPN
jgi:hypothetical protein